MKLFQLLLKRTHSKDDSGHTMSQNPAEVVQVSCPTNLVERSQVPANSLLILAQRENSVGDATLSRVSVNGKFVCDMLEDILRERPGQPVVSWKVKGKTAIPAGVYELTLETSKRFGPNTLTVNNVEGYEGVRCHGGNHAIDTEGCLLFGIRYGETSISESQRMLKVMKSITWEYFSKGLKVFIDIRNPKDYNGLA